LSLKGNDLGVETIKQFAILDKRIVAAKEVLKNHYDVLRIFSFLEKNTLGDPLGEITLTELSLNEDGDRIKIEAKGRAVNLMDIQRQSEGYSTNVNISDLSLHGLTKSRKGVY
jgi:hypothetical protein